MGSVVAAPGLIICGTGAWLPRSIWDLSGLGIKCMSSVWAVGFFASEPSNSAIFYMIPMYLTTPKIVTFILLQLWLFIYFQDCKEIQPVHSEGDKPWDFFGGNDAEAETLVLWPPHAKS